MNAVRLIFQISATVAAMLLASCANKPDPAATTKKDGNTFKNPYPEGTYENFKAEPKYPKTYDVWRNEELLAKTDASNSNIIINLSTQRGILKNGDEVVMDYPICSGIKSRPTPPGTYKILEKVVDKSSNRYGKMYDAEGNVINGDADAFTDTVPEGGKFVGAPMKYWMRLTWDGVGHHIGPVKRYPASHACIRGPSKVMPLVYSKMRVGSTVVVE
ncbi:MAG TPA: L,D-transpeptidase family protein [Luteolibacter sp.]|jgi:hypothetical protein|nr:L,D-transpeptidase family protein [Luteolibacter sp.]